MPMTWVDVVLRAPKVITGGVEVDDGWVAVTGDRITATGSGTPPAAHQTVHAGGYLVPGFVDIHVHGGAGHAFDDGREGIEPATALHRRHGTTRSVLSLVTADLSDLAGRLESAAAVVARDPLLLGLHLEGPFLSAAHRGAHPQEHLTEPTADRIRRLYDAAAGHLVQITLAPELPGADAAIAFFLERGVRVAVGHTGADYDQTREAFTQGASILTHACNGMRPIHHRSPGPVLAAIDAGVTLEVINDGAHVHPRVVRLLHELAGGRLAYVTDAMAAAGCADGHYELGGQAVTVTGGVPRLAGSGSIAGSTLTMDGAVRQAVAQGIPLVQAVRAATTVPAAALGHADSVGSLEPGFAADAVFLDADLQVEQVWAAGTRLH